MIGSGSSMNPAASASQSSGQVRQNIGVQVGCHDSIEALGVQNHASGHSINQHFVNGDIREVLNKSYVSTLMIVYVPGVVLP